MVSKPMCAFFVLMFVVWCLFVAQILKEGKNRYIRDFCPNISDPYCPPPVRTRMEGGDEP